MKYFYAFLIICLTSYIGFGQTGKPLYKPVPKNSQKASYKKTLNPNITTLSGIPNARTTVLQQTKPTTLPALQRQPKHSRLKVVERAKNGTPIMIRGSLEQVASGRAMNQQAFDYLEAIKLPILIKNPTSEFSILSKNTDDLGHTHIKMQQQFEGIDVYGGEIWLHAQKGQVNLFNGRTYPTPNLKNITPSISKKGAQEIAIQDVSLKTSINKVTGLAAKFMAQPTDPKLIIYHQDEKEEAQLAWHYKFHPNLSNEWEYFIDAQSGEVIDAYKTLCQLHYNGNKHTDKNTSISNKEIYEAPTLSELQKTTINAKSSRPEVGPVSSIGIDLNNQQRTVHSYEISDNSFFLIDASRPMFNAGRSNLPNDPIGAIWTIDAKNTYPENDNFETVHLTTDNSGWTDKTSVSAHFNAGVAYEYFRNTFNRNSINGSGGTIVSIINVSDEDGSGFDNAFWSGSAMFYGNGRTAFQPLAKSLDVAGHEIAHGVVQRTANLRYQGESGAMNESFADVFGVLIDRDDYKLGEDVVNINVFRSGALRDMADPHNGGTRLGDNGWQPDNVSEQFLGKEDNGGVHINSGITNRAFFLIANTIGKDKAEQIYYRALTTYLVSTSQFVDLRASLLQSAADIHGNGSGEQSIVAQAFDLVGIQGNDVGNGQDSGGAVEEEIEVNPGDDFIVYTDNDNRRLYLADGNGNVQGFLTEFGVISRPSVTDDGTVIVYVGGDNKIYALVIDWEQGGTPESFVVGSEPIWRNAAISRDGKLIAALDKERINTVDVFNLQTNDSKTYELYNPTTAQGISTGEVQYADVIEFDFSGEYLMYDAENKIEGNFGEQGLTYFDIGFVKVFDNALDDFETDIDNNIIKLFSGLPDNVSIGNPTFSKNTPSIIAYEYIDPFNKTAQDEQIFEIRGLNYITGDEGTIFANNTLNVPNYSRLDDKIIFNVNSDNGLSIAEIGLQADKINPDAEGAFFFIDQDEGAQLGVWFSDGSRQLTAVNELELAIGDLEIAPNPFSESLRIQFNLDKRKDLTIELYNTLGQRQLTASFTANIGNNAQLLDTNLLPDGAYFLAIKSIDGIVTRKVVK